MDDSSQMDDSSGTRRPSGTDRPPGRPTVRRMLNTRLLVETLIVAAIIGPAAYFWYLWQVKRTADTILERAATLVEQKDDAAAAQYYFQYLKLRPGDADAQVRLAETFDRAAKGPGKSRAVQYYYEALGVAPPDKQCELHRRLAELLIELRRFGPAEDEAQEVLKREPNDPQGWRLVALALDGQMLRNGTLTRGRRPSEVGGACQRALQLRPGDAVIAAELSRLCREQPQWLGEKQQALSDADRRRLADGIMDAMVAANPRDAEALLARYGYRARYGLPGAKEDLAAVLKAAPDNLQVVLRSRRPSAARGRNGETRRGAVGPGPRRSRRSLPPLSPRHRDFSDGRGGLRRARRSRRQAGRAEGSCSDLATRPGEGREGQHCVEHAPGRCAPGPARIGPGRPGDHHFGADGRAIGAAVARGC